MHENELADFLQQIRGKRGYLLPHHGLMAITSPDLLDAYDTLYTAIALTERRLSRHEHEFVWMGVLIATDEILGTHLVDFVTDPFETDEQVVVCHSAVVFRDATD